MIPLFTSNYSIGSSILTLDSPEDSPPENYPYSIFQICKDSSIKDLFLVESNLSGFVKALKNSRESGVNLNFGLKLIICNSIEKKDSESLSSEFKIILFAKNDEGYKKLLKIYSIAATEGFYYRPRLDLSVLKKIWDENSLLLAHPFYSSFLHRNLMHLSNCNPDLEFVKEKFFFIEKNDLPFNFLIEKAIDIFTGKNESEKVLTKSIYYRKPSDFVNFVANKAIHNRKSLNSPGEDHLGSSQFCFEDEDVN